MTDTGTRLRRPQLDAVTSTAERRLVPRGATLHGFVETVTRVGGLSIAELDPITPLLVRTENSLYRITVLEPRGRRILVQGGTYFPESTPAELEGSSLGGSLLKQGWIAPGLRMEISTDGPPHRHLARALDGDPRRRRPARSLLAPSAAFRSPNETAPHRRGAEGSPPSSSCICRRAFPSDSPRSP